MHVIFTMWNIVLVLEYPYWSLFFYAGNNQISPQALIKYVIRRIGPLVLCGTNILGRSCGKLAHFMQLVLFCTPWKHQKSSSFLMFSGGIERYQWHEIKRLSKTPKDFFYIGWLSLRVDGLTEVYGKSDCCSAF